MTTTSLIYLGFKVLLDKVELSLNLSLNLSLSLSLNLMLLQPRLPEAKRVVRLEWPQAGKFLFFRPFLLPRIDLQQQH
jgi:hypothetical protein